MLLKQDLIGQESLLVEKYNALFVLSLLNTKNGFN